MSNEWIVFVLLLGANAVLAVLYLVLGCIFGRERNGIKHFVINFAIMLLCPVCGILYFIMGSFFRRVFMHRDANLADVVFSKERVSTAVHADEEREKNMVPMEEALEVSDTANLRRYMLNVLRGDITDSLRVLSKALNNEDSEVAHYAATILSEQLNAFRFQVQKMYTRILELDARCKSGEEVKEEVLLEKKNSILLLVQYMEKFMSQDVFTSLEQETYTRMMNEICDILYEDDPAAIPIEFYENAVTRLLDIKFYEKAELLTERAQRFFPDELASYDSALRLYFAMGEKEKFYDTMEKLKASDIIVDQKTLELIRTFTIKNNRGDEEKWFRGAITLPSL